MQKSAGFTWRWLFRNSHPLFLPLVFYVVGLLLSNFLGGISIPYLLAILLLTLVNAVFTTRKSYSAFLILMAFLMAGTIRHSNYNKKQNLKIESSVHQLKLIRYLGETEKSYKFIAQIKSNKARKTFFQSPTKILLYLKKSKQNPTIGQTVLVNGRISKIEKPTNPHQFDYANFLAKKRIFYQIFSKEYQLQNSYGFVYELGIARKNWSDFIAKYYKNKANIYVSSLILADNTAIGKAERELFSKAGIAHLFALSGLHVGIVFGLILLLFYPFSKYIKNNNLQLLALLFVWLFAIFAGWQPSVVRASFMLSLFVVSRSIQRPLSVFDTLTVSAFFLLLFNPNWLWDVGFQLSYIAVFFIACSVHQFDFLTNKKSKIQTYIVGLLLVSTTASIATAPLTLYYFHHFSWMGLLINLILVPLFPLVMLVSAINTVFSSMGLAPSFWVKFSDFLFGTIDWFLQKGISVQGDTFSDLSLLASQVILAYCLILMFYLIAKGFKWSFFVFFLSILIAFHSIGWIDGYKKANKKEFVFFDAGRDGLILYREGFYGKVLYTNPNKIDEQKKYILESYKIKEKIKNLDFIALENQLQSPLPQKIFINKSCVLSINTEDFCNLHYSQNSKENLVLQKHTKPWNIKNQGALTIELN